MKFIAKNTILLYIRTILIMIIAIYSSRILLDRLGVENYGVYNIVGGVVAIFSSLKGVFAQATQRFLNFEKGKHNFERVNQIFNISLIIHLILGVGFVIIVGAFGFIYIPKYLVLPEGMLGIAQKVFVISLITAFVSILTIPYDSVIIANEKFNFYSICSIIDVLVRLGVIYLIHLGTSPLLLYAILIAIVTVLIRIVHILYSIKFKECKLSFKWDKGLFKELASFSWWNFLGNTAFSLTNEGVNFVINSFGGVTANAARGLAYQVKNAINQLCSNVGVASRPYISESVATKDRDTIFSYVILVSKAMYLMVALLSLPLLVYTDQFMSIWLVDVPENAVSFVMLVIIQTIVRSPQTAIDILFSSYGKMKRYQIIQSISLFMSLPLAYIFLKMGFPLYFAFIAMIVVEALTLNNIILCARKELEFPINYYFKSFLLKTILSVFQLTIVGVAFHFFIKPNGIIQLCLYSVAIVVIGIGISYFSFLSKSEKETIRSLVLRIKQK